MTQHSMLDTGPRIRGLAIALDDLTHDFTDGLDVTVRQVYTDGVTATVWSGRLVGTEVDFLDTLVTEVTSAFMYGKAGDVARAAVAVNRQAKRHARAVDRVGS